MLQLQKVSSLLEKTSVHSLLVFEAEALPPCTLKQASMMLELAWALV